MNKIRAFIAIHLPSAVRNALDETIKNLSRQVPDRAVRWVKPDLMHVTLRFLGDTAETSLPELKKALDNLASRHGQLDFNLDKLGCFPNCKRPRVIWAGMQGDVQAASGLKNDLDKALQDLGWQAEDRPFRAHITLGRVKNWQQLKNVDWDIELQKIAVPVREIHLVESNLTPQGPIYTIRHTSQLNPKK